MRRYMQVSFIIVILLVLAFAIFELATLPMSLIPLEPNVGWNSMILPGGIEPNVGWNSMVLPGGDVPCVGWNS